LHKNSRVMCATCRCSTLRIYKIFFLQITTNIYLYFKDDISVSTYILLEVKKAEIGSQSPKTEFGAQNEYGRVIYPSLGNFIWSKKNYTFRGQIKK
jgi:hypothetical protein